MLAAAAAILAGLFYALTSFVTRLGLEKASPGTAVLVSVSINLVVFWALFFLLLPPSSLLSMAVFPFIAAGIAGPFLGRLTLFTGMQRIGVSLAYPIYNTQVLFAAVGGLLLLQEHLTPLGGLGILLLLSGVAILGTDSRAGNISGPQRKVDLLWPLASGLFFGMSYVFRKMGLNISPDIFLGLPIVASSSFLAVSLPAPITGQRLSILKGSVLAMLLFASALSAVAQFFSIWAIEMGRIVAVIPLQNTSPLFTVALSALFLRKLERVTRRVAAGVVLVVAGGALVNL